MAADNNKNECDKIVSEIERVANLIGLCIEDYMTKDETMARLFKDHNVETCYTKIIWDKLIEENRDFFEKYYVRVKLIKHVKKIVSLIRQYGIPNDPDSTTRMNYNTADPSTCSRNGDPHSYFENSLLHHQHDPTMDGQHPLSRAHNNCNYDNVPCPPTLTNYPSTDNRYPHEEETPTRMLCFIDPELLNFFDQEQAMMMPPVATDRSTNGVQPYPSNDHGMPPVPDQH